MAKAYRDGKGWAIRLRYKRQEIYLSGFETAAAAEKAAKEKKRAIDGAGRPKGLGPWRTSVGQALQDYGRERLAHMKGGKQEANRINRYLRALGLELFSLSRHVPEEGKNTDKGPFWTVRLVPCPEARAVPKGLRMHREKQTCRARASDEHRARLARTMVADVTPYQVQALITAMEDAGYRGATVELERSLLRTLFNHARNVWWWPEPLRNPAVGLNMPEVDNKRQRVISNKEWSLIIEALQRAKKRRHIIPALALLLDTTMRSSELLLTARWQDVDMVRCVLKLNTAKAGGREVPLSPTAMAILQQLPAQARTVDPAARILPITYETLKAAWIKACRRAGIEDAHIHDLRHTGTTRYALEYNGNYPLLKVITGHKTDSQLSRYINLKADDAVITMHGNHRARGVEYPVVPSHDGRARGIDSWSDSSHRPDRCQVVKRHQQLFIDSVNHLVTRRCLCCAVVMRLHGRGRDPSGVNQRRQCAHPVERGGQRDRRIGDALSI